jgi:hypothetical protein
LRLAGDRKLPTSKTGSDLSVPAGGKESDGRFGAKANIKALQQIGALVRQMDRQANCKRQIKQV